ncbi:MAG: 50S ribosomal protein L5 [Ignavibacteria bacterium]|nr:50S ribosomal protein L5 [Ignavibacteria bacterium]
MATEKKEKKQAKPEKAEDLKGKKTSKKSEEKEHFVEEKVPVRLFDIYKNDVVKKLSNQFGYKNPFQVPKLKKISINVGLGAATQDPKIVEVIAKELENIVGQKPIVTKAKKSVSNFKLREGMKIGAKVTLRKARMYEFLDKLINVAIPRIRDFRGVPDKAFDGNGNYTLGVKEHVIFPEVNIDAIQKHFGMDITFVTSAHSDDEARELLRAFGMPFVKKEVTLN